MAEKLTEQEKIRRQKMEELREKGIDPFGHAYARTHRSGDIRSEYGECTKEELFPVPAEREKDENNASEENGNE